MPKTYVFEGNTTNAAIEKGSFVSTNGRSWTALSDSNLCIKAFTQTSSAANTAPKITTTEMQITFNMKIFFEIKTSSTILLNKYGGKTLSPEEHNIKSIAKANFSQYFLT